MTPERAKELLPIIKAFSEGKTIQTSWFGVNDWQDTEEPKWFDNLQYRIKPEPKYGWIILSPDQHKEIGYSCFTKIFDTEEDAKEFRWRCGGKKVIKIRLDDEKCNTD